MRWRVEDMVRRNLSAIPGRKKQPRILAALVVLVAALGAVSTGGQALAQIVGDATPPPRAGEASVGNAGDDAAYVAWAEDALGGKGGETGAFEPAIEAALVTAANTTRGQAGLGPLGLSLGLARVARAHAADMLARGYFNHTDPEGRTPSERIALLDRHFVGVSGENLAKLTGWRDKDSERTAAAIHESWLTSPGHRENILRPDWTRVGIGVVRSAGTVLAVQVFGDERGFLTNPPPLRLRRGARIDPTLTSRGAPASRFALAQLGQPAALDGALPVERQRVSAPPGRYRMRFFFRESPAAFLVVDGPIVTITP